MAAMAQVNLGPAPRQITCPRPESQKATLNFPPSDTETSANMQVVGSRVVSTLFIPDGLGLHEHACKSCCGCTGRVSVFYSAFNSVMTTYHCSFHHLQVTYIYMFPIFPIMDRQMSTNCEVQPNSTEPCAPCAAAVGTSWGPGPSVLQAVTQHRGIAGVATKEELCKVWWYGVVAVRMPSLLM